MDLTKLHPKALAAAMKGGTDGWGTVADVRANVRYSDPVKPASRRRCHCGCNRRATLMGMANGLGMVTGCELAIARWVKTGGNQTAQDAQRVVAPAGGRGYRPRSTSIRQAGAASHPIQRPKGTTLSAMIRLAKLKCAFPFAGGSSYGGGKKTSCCPVCGASSATYRYPRGRRWKHCFGCGYDRFEQELFEATRSAAKKGRELSQEKIQLALAYHAKVFGRHPRGAAIGG